MSLRDRDIVCFSNDWDGDPLSKTHIMRVLARENRVLWVDSLGNRAPRASASDAARAWRKVRLAAHGLVGVERNIHVLTPLYVPGYGSETVRRLNGRIVRVQVRAAMRRLGMRRPISWSFLPSAAPVAGRLGEAVVVYHAVDEFSAFSDASPHVAELERRIVSRADVVFVASERLLGPRRRQNPNTVLVRHGVDHAHFARALDPALPVPADLARLPRPVIGFFGLVADWIDLPLVRRVADANPGASVVLVGKIATSTAALADARNVHLLGPRPYAELPGYAKGFDVALTPFVVNALTLASSPLKAREYVAAGLPNVCTDLPEVRLVPGCTVATTPELFVAEVGRALQRPGPDPARSALVRDDRWEARVEELAAHVLAAEAGPAHAPRARLVPA
jgi:hypothetical protein